jgi:anti-sigma B factor antagonist
MNFHDDELARELLIADYLLRRLDARSADQFEAHYLGCDECFEEIGASELFLAALSQPTLQRRQIGTVIMLDFALPAQITAGSPEFDELSRSVLQRSDTKVLIDLSRVSRIDSAGLGLLMSCYSHVLHRQGNLKLLHPPKKVQNLLEITKMNSILEAYENERDALASFEAAQQH